MLLSGRWISSNAYPCLPRAKADASHTNMESRQHGSGHHLYRFFLFSSQAIIESFINSVELECPANLFDILKSPNDPDAESIPPTVEFFKSTPADRKVD